MKRTAAIAQADGYSKRKSGLHQFLKRRKNRVERHKAKTDPEVQPGYGKYKGYET